MPINMLEVAREVTTEMGLIWNPSLERIIGFCAQTNELVSFRKIGNRVIDATNDSELRSYLRSYIASYFREIDERSSFRTVNTVADPALDVVLTAFVPNLEQIATISTHHRLAMAAENLLGKLLERYLASQLEPHGWIWCAGNTVKSVDFLSPDLGIALQVKNRSNTENSSSAAIRQGTTIQKWFRVHSRTGNFNWEAFPADIPELLSEQGFYAYIQDYALRR